jgi:hypothetical protein
VGEAGDEVSYGDEAEIESEAEERKSVLTYPFPPAMGSFMGYASGLGVANVDWVLSQESASTRSLSLYAFGTSWVTRIGPRVKNAAVTVRGVVSRHSFL